MEDTLKGSMHAKDLVTETLSPLIPDVISKQATITIGVIGHSSHGKSTLVKAISGVQTARFKSERDRVMTIKLGYANAKIYKCDNPDMPRPQCYTSRGSSHPNEFPCDVASCKGTFKLIRHVSFVDCPGHPILVAPILQATAVMDAALLLIAANEPTLMPQTLEHLAATEIVKIKHLLILQNKVDLVTEDQVKAHCDLILSRMKGTLAEGAPVIPISAHLKSNIDTVCEQIVQHIPLPLHDLTSEPKLMVIRSFDVNRPNCAVVNKKGGVAGGKLLKGVLKVGDYIEVRPGIVTKDSEGRVICKPLRSVVVSLRTETTELESAVPGGLIGVGTAIDPGLCQADKMVGHVMGALNTLPDIYVKLQISYFVLRRLLGLKTEMGKKGEKVKNLAKDELLMVIIGPVICGGRVSAVKGDLAKIVLSRPVCTEIGEKIALCRRVERDWRLIGWGQIIKGVTIEPTID